MRTTSKDWITLKEIAGKIECGPFGSNLLNTNYVESGVPMIRPFNLRKCRSDYGEIALLEARFLSDSSLSSFGKDTVFFARVGEIGVGTNVYDEATISPNIIAASVPSMMDARYISVFASTEYGTCQLEAEVKAVAQPTISTETVRDFRIPLFSHEFRLSICEVFDESERLLSLSKRHKDQSEQTLLQALGLENWQPPNPLTYEASAASAFTSNRLDAEFFNSKYDAALDALRAAGAKSLRPLGDFLKSLTNGHTPLRHNLSKGDVPFICSEHVQDFEVDLESSKRILTEHHKTELKRTQLKNNDILLTIKGRVGNAAIVEGLEGAANINQDVALLRMNKELPHWWIISFLNSRFGKLMTEKYQTGQINPFLSLGTIRTLPIPVFEDKLMQEVGQEMRQLVLEARAARHRSKALLEHAKRAVEIAIETDEASAKAYLDNIRD